jgi:hypothetical protein
MGLTLIKKSGIHDHKTLGYMFESGGKDIDDKSRRSVSPYSAGHKLSSLSLLYPCAPFHGLMMTS